MARRRARLGVLTGGGDCPGLNAVIRAVVKAAHGDFGWEVIGIEDSFEGLLAPDKARPITPADVRGILPRGGTILGTTNRSNPFAYRTLRDGQVVVEDRSADALRSIAELGLDGLIVIGGDGSLKIGLEFQRLGVPIVGVPKTIDNDLSATDVTFGFDTAVLTATEAIDKLHTTAESHHRIMILELMGRTVGWIATHAGIAGGADVILIPEIPFSIQCVCDKIHDRDAHGAKFSIVVVAEGAAPIGGEVVTQETFGALREKRLGGIGQRVAEALAACTDREVRVTVLGHLQRGGSPTPFDRLLGTRFGAAAVHLFAKGGFGRMVALRGTEIVDVPLEDAVGQIKSVPPDGELVRTARALGISFGDGL